MPSQNPTSFASAAAASNTNDSTATGRNGSGSGDWSRRPNGATQTFRRPSQLNTNSVAKDSTSRDSHTPTTGTYVPPHLNSAYQSSSRNGQSSELRYTRETMLGIFSSHGDERFYNGLLEEAMTENSSPRNGVSEWKAKVLESDKQHNPDGCWNLDNSAPPLGLVEMTEEERELFLSSVNSPLKAPQVNKDGLPTPGLNGRKSSISQGQGGPANLRGERPGPRRRETSDSTGGGPATPGFNRRDESISMTPPTSLLRRRTDFKEGNADSSLGKTRLEGGIDTTSPFASWKRTVSGPMSAGIAGPSSPWAVSGPQSAGFGAFGNFAYDTGTPSTPSEKRPGFGGLRSESRFKSLMNQESSEDLESKSRDSSMLGMGKRAESFLEKQNDFSLTTHQEEKMGSAALFDTDLEPVAKYDEPGTMEKQFDELGFSSLGAPVHSGGRNQVDVLGTQDDRTISSSSTNPFQSSENDLRYSGLGEEESTGLASFNTRMQTSRQQQQQPLGGFDVSDDQSRTASVGPQRNFPPLGGLGNLSGLPSNSPWSTTTPGGIGQQRPNPPFGSGIFSSMADISSPGGAFATPTNSAFPINRSRIGGLLPGHNRDGSNDNSDTFAGRSQPAPSFPFTSGEPAPTIASRGTFDDLFNAPSANDNRAQSAVTQPSTSSGRSPQFDHSSDPTQPPPAQQKQMVMPDRMRWLYRDPSGQLQGPWTGLEMHDWYKNGYFSPELQVKKVEDPDYEPLAQLIRKIGNSREPFLVPQIGIPHGPPKSVNDAAALGTPGGNANLGIQPPFGNQFPSFGTTLTAEQQNALERRKQEEQILMARQKEHLQQQQIMMKNIVPGAQGHGMHFPMQPPLHHQASSQSLHTQPSYGNVSSAGGFLNHAVAPGHGSPFGNQGFGHAPHESFARGNDLPNAMDRMNLGTSSSQESKFNGATPQQDYNHQQQVSAMLQDRARLQAQQEQWNSIQQDIGHDRQDRLEQFRQLRAGEQDHAATGPIATKAISVEPQSIPSSVTTQEESGKGSHSNEPVLREISESSSTPLPAPAARRNRQHVAEALAAESSRSETPIDSPVTASLAPWAKENQTSKVPSFQEIQEAEARRAAQQEELAAAARRQQAEQERINAERVATATNQAQTAGLPSSANWATGSPAAISGSPWAKPAVSQIGNSAGPVKTKTLAQIQKEEENRKQRAAAAAAAANITAVPVVTPGGKSYANLASKVSASSVGNATTGGAWNVVGASGKAKTPASPVVSPPTRTVSSGAIPAGAKPKPQPVRSNTGINGAQIAQDAFQRWAQNSLSNGLNSSINVDDFVKNLISYPLEEEIISDAVYASSQILDGYRFAREFIQRKREADKGKVLDVTASNFVMGGGDTKTTYGGWNEVAKKAAAPVKEEAASSTFKVVPAKKKGKK